MHQWKFQDNPACDCGNTTQTIQHTVTDRLNRKFKGKMKDFLKLTSEALDWVANLTFLLFILPFLFYISYLGYQAVEYRQN